MTVMQVMRRLVSGFVWALSVAAVVSLTGCGGLSYVTLQGDKELNPNRLGATSLGVMVKVFLLTERKGFDDAKLEELWPDKGEVTVAGVVKLLEGEPKRLEPGGSIKLALQGLSDPSVQFLGITANWADEKAMDFKKSFAIADVKNGVIVLRGTTIDIEGKASEHASDAGR